MMEQVQNEIRIIRLPEVCHICGIARATLYKRVKNGVFISSISLGGQAVGWVESEVKIVLKALIRGDTEEQLKNLIIDLTNQRKDI